MRRLFYKGILKDTVEITGEDAHHLKNVNRAKIGDTIVVVDDQNSAAEMQIAHFTGENVTLKLLKHITLTGKSCAKVTAGIALLKGEKIDFTVQKLTELGVSVIAPIITERVIVRLDEKKRAQKLKRLEKIALEAAKQSGALPPKILPIMSLTEFLNRKPKNLIFFYENEEELSIKDLELADDISFLIGPEGGFSPDEAKNIIDAGARVVTLGKRILRAETAAIVGLTLIMREKGEF